VIDTEVGPKRATHLDPLRDFLASTRAIPGTNYLLLATLGAITLLLMPVSSLQNTLTYQGLSTSGGSPMVLAVAPVEALSFTMPCQAVIDSVGDSTAPSRVFGTSSDPNQTGSLSLTIDRSRILWGTPRVVAESEIPSSPAADCTITGVYSAADNTLNLAVGNQQVTASGAFPRLATDDSATGAIVTSLWTQDSLRPVTSAQVVLHPSTVNWPVWRWLLVTGVFACVVLALGSATREPRRLARRLRALLRRCKPRWIDWILLLPLTISWISIPPGYDDGWVLTTNRAFGDLGFFSNYYSVGAAPQVQGFWWSFLERVWLFQGSPVLLMRLPSIVIIWFTWICLRSLVIDRLSEGDRARDATRLVAASIFGVFAATWIPTLRPEVVVSALLALAFATTLFARTPSSARLGSVFAITALALAVHQTGLLLLAPASFAAYRVLRSQHSNAFPSLAWASMIGFSVASTAVLLHASIGTIRWSASAFAAEAGHNQLFNEIERLVQVVASPFPGRIWMITLLVLSSAAFALRADRALEPARTAGYLSCGTVAALLLTSSKWEAHTAALIVPTLVMSAAATSSNWRWLVSHARSIGAVAAISTVLAISITVTGQGYAGAFFPWQVGVPGTGARMAALATLIFLLSGSAWIWSRSGRSLNGALVPAIFANLVITGLLLATPYIPLSQADFNTVNRGGGGPELGVGFSDSLSPTYTWPGSMQQACGVARTIRVVPVPENLAVDWQVTGDTATTEYGTTKRPLSEISPVLGVPLLIPKQTSEAATPWFSTGASTAVQWWVEATSATTEQKVEFIDLAGAPVGTRILRRSGEPNTWQIFRTDIPAGTRYVRVTYRPFVDGVSSSTNLTDASSTVPADSVMFGRVWRNPDETLLLPCFPMPSIRTGVIAPFDWSFGVPAIAPSGPGIRPVASEAVMLEVGCALSNRGRRTCLYRVSQPLAPGLRAQLTSTVVR